MLSQKLTHPLPMIDLANVDQQVGSMALTPAAIQLLANLQDQEPWLQHRYGVRVRVDKVTADGRNALCSACQVRHPFFLAKISAFALVALAHLVLKDLHRFGITPLISTLPARSIPPFVAIEKGDPFRLRDALRAAGKEGILLEKGSVAPIPLPGPAYAALLELHSQV